MQPMSKGGRVAAYLMLASDRGVLRWREPADWEEGVRHAAGYISYISDQKEDIYNTFVYALPKKQQSNDYCSC
jgi:hypothetical protein